MAEMSEIKIGLITTVGGQIQIVDVGDDGEPLVKFYNEFNKPEIANTVYQTIAALRKKEKEAKNGRK